MDRTNLPQEAVKINGQYIEDVLPGYQTITTSGREGLAAELDTYTVGSADGETVKGSRYPIREIVVEFLLIGSSLEDYRDKMENLANLLSLEEADFVFNDESDRYYTGRPLLQADVTKYKNGARGSYVIRCSYPFKRSVAVATLSSTDPSGVVVGNNSATFTIDYKGTRPAHPLLRATFAAAKVSGDYNEDGDCGFIAFMDGAENIIQLGNPDVLDVDSANKNVTSFNSEFTELTGWTDTNISIGNITDTYWRNGAGQTQSYAKPTGTASLVRSISNAVNFDLNLVHRLAVNATAETGSFECLAKASNKVVTGFTITKTGSGTTGVVSYIIDDTVVGTDNIDLSLYNTNFGYCKRTDVYVQQSYQQKVVTYVKQKGKKKKKKKVTYVTQTRPVFTGYSYTQSNLVSSISRDDDVLSNVSTVTFSIGNLPDRTFKSSSIFNVAATSVELNFAGNFHTNAVHSADLIGKKGVPFAEIPNVFTSGDIVEADCNDASVMLYRSGSLYGRLAPMYGALGNDWEDFELKPGTNVISAVWSDWVDTDYKPLIQIIFNEVYL